MLAPDPSLSVIAIGIGKSLAVTRDVYMTCKSAWLILILPHSGPGP